MAVLETEEQDDFGSSPYNQPNNAASRPDAPPPARPFTRTAPAAFGMRSLAPTGRLGDTRSGRFGNGGAGFPPSPGRSLEIERILTSGWKQPRPYVPFDPPKYAGLISNVSRGGLTVKGSLDPASAGDTNQGAVEPRPDGESVPDASPATGNLVSPVADPIDAAGGSSVFASAGKDSFNLAESPSLYDSARFGNPNPSNALVQQPHQPQADLLLGTQSDRLLQSGIQTAARSTPPPTLAGIADDAVSFLGYLNPIRTAEAATPNSPGQNAFFTALDAPLTKLAAKYGVPSSYLIGLSAFESGYLDPHNAALNNPLGLTAAGFAHLTRA
jgi:flagellum-specific peptidoglycan hydrolase FlgJ